MSALVLRDLGYTHKDVLRMTPRYAIELWRAMPDPDLDAPKPEGTITFVDGGRYGT